MKKIYQMKCFAVMLLFALVGLVNAQTIVFVSSDGVGDGSSWASPAGDLQAAINAASAGTQIWIKAGTYYTPADTTFELKEGVSLYGGFAGTESDISERTDFRPGGANETILSGGNTHRVVYGESISDATVFSGITVKDGDNTAETYDTGGGMRLKGGSLVIESCAFINNVAAGNAGGLYMWDAALLTVKDCIFAGNQSGARGGATYTATGCDVVFTNCIFENNSAETDGGAVRVYQSSPTFINCTFVRNALTGGDGAAIDVSTSSSPVITNCAFWGNEKGGVTDDDLSLASSSAAATVTNCAFEGIINVYTGATLTEAGTVDISATDPKFTTPSTTAGAAGYNPSADWTLQEGSPLIDAGTTETATPIDFNGLLRDESPDIGAYEYGGVVPYYLSAEVTGTGTVNPSSIYVAPASDLTFTITPEVGFEITAATYNSTDIMNDLVDNLDGTFGYSLTGISEDGLLEVTFEPLPTEYTVTVTAGSNGSITPSGDIQVTVSDETVFTITPDANFAIETLELNGTSVLEDTVDNNDGTFAYTLTGVGENSTLSVTFTALYTITVSAGANGTIEPSGDIVVTIQDETEFTITPAYGYSVETLLLNSTDVSGDMVDNGDGTFTYTLTGVDADGTLAVTFTEYIANVIYVKPDGSGDGSSWANAMGSVQDAMNASDFRDEVWVAAGTYLTPGEVVDSSFTLVNGVSIFGGFAGTESSKDERTDFGLGMANETKLSADLDGNGFLTGGNGSRVIFGEFISSATTIDGFTITGGFSDVTDSNGAGMKLRASSPHIINCTFFDNYCDDGSHMYLYRSGDDVCDPIIENCFFIKGYANDDGGAIYSASGTTAKFINCIFSNNWANDEGGAIRIYECSPEFYNCTFVLNALPDTDPGGGGTYGPAVRCYQTASPYMNTEPIFVNCAFWKNQDGSDLRAYDISNTGAMATAGAFATVKNCALDTLSATSCIVADTIYIGPINDEYVNPGFVDVSGAPGYQGYDPAADWNLVSTSVLIGEGTSSEPLVPTTDIRGVERGAEIDIGAYEYSSGTGIEPIITKSGFNVRVYPNPSNGDFVIESNEGIITEVNVFDITGRMIKRFENLQYERVIPVNLTGNAKGLYFLRIKDSKGRDSIHKVIIK